MQDKIQNMIREFERTRKIRRRAYAALTAMAIVVSLGTGYALMQPAQTMSAETICGLTEHVHGDSCYETVLVCTDENREGHAHSEECYPMEYICGQEVVEAHSHSEECNSITCGLEETAGHAHDETCTGIACGLEATEGHTHSDSCYGVACGKAETEGHSHGDGCYEQQSRLTCTTKEGEGHSHSDSCYGNTCGKSESDGHSHDDGCYSEKSELSCSRSESSGHGHGDGCYGEDGSLICSESESEGHSHGDGCYTTKRELTCGQSECEAHSHDASCEGLTCGQSEYEAHAHGEGCYVQENVLVCKEAEVAPHAHDESCNGLICTVEECAPHAHDETCNGLICGQEEHDAHIHEDACSTLTCEVEETEGHAHTTECEGGRSETPDCGKEECEPYITDHIHGETCYETRLVCELPEHIHEDACYEAEPEAFCGFEEHTHGDECYGEPVLVCEDTTEGHEHNEDCSTIELICELPEHVHVDECFVEPVEVMVILPEGAEIPEDYDDVRTFTSEDGTFGVAVYAPMGTIPEGATLVAEILTEDSEEYAAAADSVAQQEEAEKSYDGLIAMDIRFEDADGNEVEPYDQVYVVINALGLLPENADPESVSIQHHAEIQSVSTFSLRDEIETPAEPEIVVTTVANFAEDTGVVELVENEDIEAQDVLTAFSVESFSMFTISWNKEIDPYEIACIDTTGIAVTAENSSYECMGKDVITFANVKPTFAGYEYRKAVVATTPEDAAKADAVIVQFKYESGWQYLADASADWVTLNDGEQVYFIYEKLVGMPVIITDLDGNLIDGAPTVIPEDVSAGEWGKLSDCAPVVDGYMYTKADSVSGNILRITAVRCVNGAWYVSDIYDESQVGTYLGNNVVRLMYDTATIPVSIHLVDEMGTEIDEDVTKDIKKNTDWTISGLVSSNVGGKTYNHARLNSVSGKRITDIRYDNATQQWNYKAAADGLWYAMGIGQSPDIYAVYMGNTFRGVTPPGVTVNMFNYYALNRDHKKGINKDHTLKFIGSSGTDQWNIWTGTDGGVYQGIVKRNLGADGYPVLTENVAGAGKTESLAYLFDLNSVAADTGTTIQTKAVYPDADYLFQLDENGYYRYSAEKFTDKNGRVVNGNFALLVNDGTEADPDWNFKLYQNETSNRIKFSPFVKTKDIAFEEDQHDDHFGMHIKTDFTMPKDGLVNGKNMIFNFAGDDDVWLFIDGALILDMGGIHSHFSGYIDFATGEVYINNVYNAGKKAVTTTLYDMLKAAGKSDEWINANMIQTKEGNWIFRDYTSHNFDFFYMERGSGRSNCTIEFNLPTIPKNSLVVGKELEARTDDGSEDLVKFLTGELDYTFEVLKVVDGVVTKESMFDLSDPDNLPTYQIMENSMIVGGGTVNKDGKFTLKAGQLAVFDGLLKGEEGQYVVRETLPSNLSGQYQGAEYDVVGAGGTSTGTIEDTEKKFDEYTTAPLDASETTTTVIYRNLVDARTLSSLSVTKEIGEGSAIDNNLSFKMKILLGGENLAIGTPYVITDATGTKVREGTVGADGIIQIKRDETINVNGILQGTEVTVYEVNEGNYQVRYDGIITADDGTKTSMSTNALGISGTVVKPKSDVDVTVTNSDYSMSVNVPISKRLEYAGEGEQRTFRFNAYRLNEQMEPVSTTPAASVEISTNGSNVGSANIELGFGRTTANGDYFYRINEVIPDDQGDIDYDVSSYIVKITVSQNDRGEKKAEVTGITLNGETKDKIEFVNSKNGVLSLSKVVKQNGQDVTGGDFTFQIEIPGVSGTYNVYDSNGTKTGTITFDEGEATPTVTLKAGQTITIKGLPIGKTAKITELNTNGYVVSWSGDMTGATYDTKTLSKEFTGEKVVAVICTNAIGPELPSTGGIGTTLYTVLGGLMMACAAGLLELQRRRRSIVD